MRERHGRPEAPALERVLRGCGDAWHRWEPFRNCTEEQERAWLAQLCTSACSDVEEQQDEETMEAAVLDAGRRLDERLTLNDTEGESRMFVLDEEENEARSTPEDATVTASPDDCTINARPAPCAAVSPSPTLVFACAVCVRRDTLRRRSIRSSRALQTNSVRCIALPHLPPCQSPPLKATHPPHGLMRSRQKPHETALDGGQGDGTARRRAGRAAHGSALPQHRQGVGWRATLAAAPAIPADGVRGARALLGDALARQGKVTREATRRVEQCYFR
eukprot:ctg_979.g332